MENKHVFNIMSFPHIDMAQVVEFLPVVREELNYST